MESETKSLPEEIRYSSSKEDLDEEDEKYTVNDETRDDDLLTLYNNLLDTKPVVTKAITAAFISGLGAALGSYLSNSANNKNPSKRRVIDSKNIKTNGVNWLDVFVFSLHGGLIGGPVGHYWFDWLSKQNYSTVKSTLIDQLMVQPPLLVFMFLFLDTSKAAIREIHPSMTRTLSTIGPTIVNSWKFWPLAVWCTFRYLKKKHYTVALNLCSLAWTMYLNKGGGGGGN